MKILFAFSFTLLFIVEIQGQTSPYTAVGRGVATTFVSDYHSLGINSSALGWTSEYENKKFTFSTSEVFFSFQSDSLNKQKFKNFGDILKTQVNNRTIDSSSIQSILNSTLGYAQAGVNIRAHLLWFGGAFRSNRLGGFAISIQEDYGFSLKMNTNNAALFFHGNWQNLIDSASTVVNGDSLRIAFSNNLDADTAAGIYSLHLTNPLDLDSYTQGTRVGLIWNRNYNIGWGRKIFGNDSSFALYGGIGARYIQSMAYYQLVSENDGLQVNSSLSPTSLNFNGFLSQVNPLNFSSIGGFFAKPVGEGYGIDLSASIILWNKLKVAAAVNNIGQVKYTQHKYTANNALPQEIAIDHFDPNNSAANVRTLLKSQQLLEYEGKTEVMVNNAAHFRFGASFRPIRQINVGFDFVAPFDKENPLSHPNGIIAFGADFRPFKVISLNVGYISGGAFQGYIPAGVNIILRDGRYEFGVSSQDMVHLITKNGNSVSAAFGFARFRF